MSKNQKFEALLILIYVYQVIVGHRNYENKGWNTFTKQRRYVEQIVDFGVSHLFR